MTDSTFAPKLRVPVGKAVFPVLRQKKYAYADKTALIPVLENLDSEYPVVLRPRRFGKSLFVSMLETYYDKAQANSFARNFSGTYIGEHPTPERSAYLVLHLDFSGIDSDDPALHFKHRVLDGLSYFLRKYEIAGRESFLSGSYASPADLLNSFCKTFLPVLGNNVFLMIDEYDQFANDLLSSNPEEFRRITSAQGFLKNFYSVIKSFADRVFARIYITGVLPLSLDSLTSGFSIATNYSWHPKFAAACGLTEAELRQLIQETVDLERGGQTEEGLFQRMKELFNGYRFDPASPCSVFHTSLCLEYLRFLREMQREPVGSELLDSSVAMDLSKIHGILAPGRPDFVRNIVERCLRGQAIPVASLSKVINLNQSGRLSDNDVLTTLYCMGYLTFASGTQTALVCPNKTILEQFFGYYFQYLTDFGTVDFDPKKINAACQGLSHGNIQPFLEYVATSLKASLGIHSLLNLSETHIQLYLLGAARLLTGFRATAEEEALGAGHTDILIRPVTNSIQHSYLLELKHLPKKEDTPAALTAKTAEASKQLEKYSRAENIRSLPGLQKIIVVFVGAEIRSATAL